MIRRVLAAAAVMASVLSGATPRADGLEPTLRITSPLGRTGLPGTIRFTRHGNTAGLETESDLGGAPKYPCDEYIPEAIPCSTW